MVQQNVVLTDGRENAAGPRRFARVDPGRGHWHVALVFELGDVQVVNFGQVRQVQWRGRDKHVFLRDV